MTLDQDILQIAVHVRMRLNNDLREEERQMNYEVLSVLGKYAEFYALSDAKFISAMLRTYREVPGQRSLFDVPHDGAKYLNNHSTKVRL